MATKAQEAEECQIYTRRQESAEARPPTCCICFDVRSGAVAIGLFNLIVHASGLIMSTSVVLHQKDNEMMKKYMATDENRYYNAYYMKTHGVDHMVGVMIACLSFLITVMLVYGAALRRPSYILPFFCMQVFDLALYILASAASVSYAPQIKRSLEMNPHFQEQFGKMNYHQFLFFLIGFCLIVLFIKSYMMSVVWACFKYCKVLNEQRELIQPSVDNQQGAIIILPGQQGMMALLPSYEDTVKQLNNPPPAYQ